MSFATAIAADLAVLFSTSEYCETISYEGASISALVTRTTEAEKQQMLVQADAVIVVKKSDVASPTDADRMVFDASNWRFSEIIAEDELTWTLSIHKTGAV